MRHKNKYFILLISFIITIQILLLVNNNQKSSFRFFTWNIQNLEIGKIISVSFLSGFIISNILNISLINKNRLSNSKSSGNGEVKENQEYYPNEEENSSFDIPPQRDVREVQPTISVNYRVVKNMNENEYQEGEESSSKDEFQEDWDTNKNNENNDW